MTSPKTGVLIINLGTPDSPSLEDVRRYLRELLMDARVMDIPFWRRFLLVNCVIVPFRASQSAKAYQQLLWGPQGFPLKVCAQLLEDALGKSLGDGFLVKFAMRYRSPGIKPVLSHFKDKGFERLIVIPLYPQYASSTTGSAIEEVKRTVKTWRAAPEIKFINQFCDHPLFIKSFVEIGKKYIQQKGATPLSAGEQSLYDHYLFSYHGLPERQALKSSRDYPAQCFETSRLLAQELGINKEDYTVCFQSRLGKEPWLKPYTEEVIRRLPERGKKRVLVFAPSFVADCLETIVEIGVEYKKLFLERGGERLQLVESLNISPAWVECLKQIVLNG